MWVNRSIFKAVTSMHRQISLPTEVFMIRLVFLALFAALLSGCAYNVQPSSTQAVNIYTTYDQKIKGKWILVMDPSLKDVNKQVKPSSYVCGAHTYPVATGDSLATSVKRTMLAVFEDVVEQNSLPPADALAAAGAKGTILVRLEDFTPKLTCSMGFWSGTCTAQADIGFGVTVRIGSESVLSTQVMGSKSADGDAGGACSGGSAVLAEGITKSTRDALERLAERVSNSQRLRNG